MAEKRLENLLKNGIGAETHGVESFVGEDDLMPLEFDYSLWLNGKNVCRHVRSPFAAKVSLKLFPDFELLWIDLIQDNPSFFVGIRNKNMRSVLLLTGHLE